ncbi:MAG: polysaccharide biosynthesis protein [Verrucomicrobia bacterium]|nr:polysaccharide biosynthesis protein [Verrucomicrobiota bacterium]
MRKNLLIIGAGEAGQMVLAEIRNNPPLSGRYVLKGFLDDDTTREEVSGLPVLGSIEFAPEVIEEQNIQEVIIAIPSATRGQITAILDHISKCDVITKIVPGIQEIIAGPVAFSQIRRIEPSDLLGREEVGFDIDKIQPHYKGQSVLVSGAGGSIGSEIVAQLLRLPVSGVIALGHGENSIHSLIMTHKHDDRFRYIIGDVRDEEKLMYEFKRHSPDIIFHAAAHKHVPLMEDNPEEAVKTNILGTYKCARAAIAAGVKRFMLVSTDKAVNPSSIMGVTKRVAEKIVLTFNKLQDRTEFALTRFGNVLGSRGSVVPIFQSQVEKGNAITVTDPGVTRYFMSITEAARLVIKSATLSNGSVFILDMGRAVKITDLAENLLALYGLTTEEVPIVFTGLRPGEKLHEEILTQDEHLKKSSYEKILISHGEHGFESATELEEAMGLFDAASVRHDYAEINRLLKKYVPEFQRENG